MGNLLTFPLNSGTNGYCWPKGFQEDNLYQDSDGPIFWDKQLNSNNFNAEKRMISLNDQVQTMIRLNEQNRLGDHIYIPFGCEFAFSDAKINYDSMDSMIQYWN